MDQEFLDLLDEALLEAIDSREEQAAAAENQPYGAEEARDARAAAAQYEAARARLDLLKRSYVVIGYGDDAEPNPNVYAAPSAQAAAEAFAVQWGAQDIHGVYPGFIGENAFQPQAVSAHAERHADPVLYRVDVLITGTAYVRAHDAQEARDIAAGLDIQGVGLHAIGDIEVSGAEFDDPNLPDVSLSPVATVQGLYPGAHAEEVEND